MDLIYVKQLESYPAEMKTGNCNILNRVPSNVYVEARGPSISDITVFAEKVLKVVIKLKGGL